MFWIPAFFMASKDSRNPDNTDDVWVKAIFWTEVWFVMDLNASLTWKSIWNICLLAESDQWYHHMMELVAFSNQKWLSWWTSKLDINILKEKSDWIVIFSWWENSWIAKLLNLWESEPKIEEIFGMIKSIFWKKCFLEISAQDESESPFIKKINDFVYNLAKKTSTKLIVNNDYHYLNEKDKDSREIALSIKDWTKIYDSERRQPVWKYHIMTENEIREICLKNWYKSEEIDEWIQNNYDLAQNLNASILLNQKLFPKYKTPEDIQSYYDKYWTSSIEC